MLICVEKIIILVSSQNKKITKKKQIKYEKL